jgi:hypothetical protein
MAAIRRPAAVANPYSRQSGWTIDEAVRLLFVPHLVERKLIESGSTDVPIS